MSKVSSTDLHPWFDSFAEVMQVGVMILSPSHDLDFATARAVRLFGCGSLEELRGMWSTYKDRLSDSVPLDPRRELLVELPPRRDGRHGAIELSVHGVSSDDCRGVLVLVKSANSSRAMQSALRLAETARNRRLMMGAVEHELRGPLQAIAMNISLLEGLDPQESSGSGADELAEVHDIVVSAVREEIGRLQGMFDRFFSRDRKEADGPARIDLGAAVREVAKLCRTMAINAGVRIELAVEEAELAVVGDPERLHQAITNVLVNAIEAMPSGGRVSVDARRVGDDVHLVVTDDGPGISDADLERVFDLYFTTKPGGTGLGLYLAKRTLESLRGAIHVETAPGEGTRVTLTAPLAD